MLHLPPLKAFSLRKNRHFHIFWVCCGPAIVFGECTWSPPAAMGKRKSKRKQVKKARPKLDTQFTCLFCNHDKSIEVRL